MWKYHLAYIAPLHLLDLGGSTTSGRLGLAWPENGDIKIQFLVFDGLKDAPIFGSIIATLQPEQGIASLQVRTLLQFKLFEGFPSLLTMKDYIHRL